MYDYLIVGAGLYGAVFAQEAKRAGKSVLVIDKRPHIAGNVYTEKVEGINVHKYVHIFSIQIIRRSGIISPGLPPSIVLPTVRLPIITGNCTVFRLICIPLTGCGAW